MGKNNHRPSETLEQSLPRLRRFASTAIGSVELGDECVHSAVSDAIALVANRSFPAREAFIQLLFKLTAQAIGKAISASQADRDWQVIILSELEGFDLASTAKILGIDVTEVVRARREGADPTQFSDIDLIEDALPPERPWKA